MSYRGRGRLRLWIESFAKKSSKPSTEESLEGPGSQEVPLANSVDAYYTDLVQNNLTRFYRFAVQTRSVAIRDVFAKACSTGNFGVGELLNVIQDFQPNLSNETSQILKTKFDGSVLLALADLFANTARNDLDMDAAVQLYEFVYALFGLRRFSNKQALLYVEALHETGYYDQAEILARDHSLGEIAPLQPELLALRRKRLNPLISIWDWARELNALYSSLEMTTVNLLDDETLSPLDRLTTRSAGPLNGPKVSVIMPTYSPGFGIRTAVRGLLEQTWQNLEIIIVDDASPTKYQHVFSELAHLDPRVRVIHQKHNAGAYVARNAGLAQATGDFVTTADDDDWSHPDKIALQVSLLLKDPNIVATVSEHVRTTDELVFRRINSSARYLQVNYSSLMLRRQVVEEIGAWDSVNRGGDSEFLMRLRRFYGSDKVAHVRGRPLSFSRIWKGSLTSGEMYRGFTATSRILHIWAIRQWHWDLDAINQKPTRRALSSRPYAVPSSFEPGQRNEDLGLFDVIYVTDFFRKAKYVDYVLQEMRTLANKGLRVGYIHLDSPRTTKITGLPKNLLHSQLEGEITQVSLEDVAETRLLIVYDPSVGMFTDQSQSKVKSHRSILIERELPTLSGAAERLPASFAQALCYLDKTFASYFEVVGATDHDQDRLRAHLPPSRLLSDSLVWRTHINRPAVEIKPPVGKPRIGFHTYGNKYRWPRNRQTFQDVYLSDSHDTYFSGLLEPAFKKFGSDTFETAQVIDHNKTPTLEFLKEIDFWVYSPDPKLQDEVWEPVLKAMSAGKVVILPPALEDLYEDGALYGDPQEITRIVNELASDSQCFLKQAMLGQEFVDNYFSAERFYRRVSQLLSGAR